MSKKHREKQPDKYSEKNMRFYNDKEYCELYIFGDISEVEEEVLFCEVIKDMMDLEERNEIRVYIHSCGGSVNSIVALFEMLKLFKKVVTVGFGEISSAGFNLWCFGEERYCNELSVLMYHGMCGEQSGGVKDLKGYSDFINRYQAGIEAIVCKVLSQSEIDKGKNEDVWMLGVDLIKKGKAKCFSECLD